MQPISKKHVILLNNTGLFMICLYIMITSLVFNGNRYGASLAFVLAPVMLAMAASVCLMKRAPRHSWGHYIIIILICLSATYSTLLSHVVSWRNSATSVLMFAVFYVVVASVAYDASMIAKLLRFYSYLTVLICLYLLVSLVFGLNMLNDRVSIRFMGVRKDENYLSAFLTPGYAYLLYSFLFGQKRRAWVLCAAGLIFLMVFMTGSRAAFMTMVIVTFFMIARMILRGGVSFKKLLLIAACLIVGVLGFFFLQSMPIFNRMTSSDGYSENIRLKIWGYAMQAFYERPLTGSGIESGTYYVQRSLRWYTHSCFVDILTGQGIIGVVLYLALFASLLNVKKENFVFMAVMISAFFLPMFFINGYETATFWMPMTLCKIISDHCKTDDVKALLIGDGGAGGKYEDWCDHDTSREA